MSTQSQTVLNLRNGEVQRLHLPAPRSEVMAGVQWGRFDEFFTPAFWVARAWIDGREGGHEKYTLGRSLREEVAACLLGGFGMPAEIGVEAFHRLRTRRLLRAGVTAAVLELALAEPLTIGGRSVRYRYPRLKSRFIAKALARLESETPPTGNIEFRDWLVSFDGIGPKTASWITRNYRHSDEVAILDIHIQRAGRLAGIFSDDDQVERNYRSMEERLVTFSKSIQIKLSVLDSMIWTYMKRLGPFVETSLRAA